MAIELDHLSYSSISKYVNCSANWKYKYLDKLPDPKTPNLIMGSAFHGAIEEYLKSDKQADITELWRKSWADQMVGTENVEWVEESPEETFNQGLRMLTHKDVVQGLAEIMPAKDDLGHMIERKLELHVPGVPIPIIGYLDILTVNGPADFKTSATRWSDDKATNEIQSLFYLAAMNQMGMHTYGWLFSHYIFVKTKTPQFQKLTHRHTPTQLMWLFKMISNVWAGIQAGTFVENPTGWLCTPKYCPFWGVCRGKL